MTRVRLRPEIEAMVSYDAGPQQATDAFQLAGNENPFAPLPSVVTALQTAAFSRYPDAGSTRLRRALAVRHAVALDGVHVSAGSVSIIYEMISAFAGPGDDVVMSWRSFEAYPKAVTVAGANSVQVANEADGSHNLTAMARAITPDTRIVLVCSPNNPTGSVVHHDDFVAFLESVPDTVVVALDEAYMEYVRDPEAIRSRELLSSHPNLIVLRTFSKAYGLAGLRVGYALGDPAALRGIRTASVPFSVTELAQSAAVASLECDEELRSRVDTIVEQREFVRAALLAQGWDIPEPGGNFVWLPTGDSTVDAARVFREHGMLVRAFAPDGLRITIAEKDSIPGLIEAAARVRRLFAE